MMEIPDVNITVEYSIVETDGGYVVKVDGVMPTGRMHLADIGPLPTKDVAESIAESLREGDTP